jgi:hypothetical protein
MCNANTVRIAAITVGLPMHLHAAVMVKLPVAIPIPAWRFALPRAANRLTEFRFSCRRRGTPCDGCLTGFQRASNAALAGCLRYLYARHYH